MKAKRFDGLRYSHTEEFDDCREIKFQGVGLEPEHSTVEIWQQGGHANVVLVDGETNDILHATDEEEEQVLTFARKEGLLA